MPLTPPHFLGWCGWLSFTQGYVSLSQLGLRAVHCGLFLSCNPSQQRGHCTSGLQGRMFKHLLFKFLCALQLTSHILSSRHCGFCLPHPRLLVDYLASPSLLSLRLGFLSLAVVLWGCTGETGNRRCRLLYSRALSPWGG